MKYSHSYLLKIQFLGFRFSGWQKQTNAKTIHDIVDKSLSFVLLDEIYKTVGMSRTDAKVSANKYFVQLFINKKLEEEVFVKSLNKNFPQDFKVISTDILTGKDFLSYEPKEYDCIITNPPIDFVG